MSCIFCKIIEGSIPAQRVAEDDRYLCIRDIMPQAPVHLLVIPKLHVESLAEEFQGAAPEHPGLVEGLMSFAVRVAREQKLLPHGYRSVINTGKGGGQTVFHLHMHLMGGETLAEKI